MLLEAADGRFYVAGFFRRVGEWERRSVVRYLPDGRVDPSFVPPQAWDLPNRLMELQPPSAKNIRSPRGKLPEQVVEYTHGVLMTDGRLVLAGWGSFHGPAPAPGVVRLLPDGRADPSFTPPELDLEELTALTVLPDGRQWVAGRQVLTGDWVLVRLSAEGVPEPGRGLRARRPVWALASEPDGQVWVAGDEGLVRLPSGEVHALTRGSPGGLIFGVERSARLKRDWTLLGSLPVPQGPSCTLVDTNATRLSYAFYRLAP